MYTEGLVWLCIPYALFSKLNMQPKAILELMKKRRDGKKISKR